MNIVMIVSDTFRRDHLGCYGNKYIRTPYLDRFASKCVQFDNFYAASFPTMPNRADLFTGKFTFSYLGWAPLPSEENVLAEILSEADYNTIAVVDTPFFVRRAFYYDRGFKDFVWVPGQGAERPRMDFERRYEEDYCAPRTIAMAEKCLEYYHKEKFLLYVDIWDPHEPWDPPSWRVKPYYPNYAGELVVPCYWDWRDSGVKEEDINIAHACYCGEVTMVDFWVGRLLNKIESLGIIDDTVIVFTSDHGFYFGEHGYFGKGRRKNAPFWQQGRESLFYIEKEGKTGDWYRSPLYEEVTRVPLLVYIPGISHRRVQSLVSSVDLMPTLLQLAGVEIPESVQGQSLVPFLEEKKRTIRDFVVTSWPFSEIGEKTRVVDAGEREVKEMQPIALTTEKWAFLYTAEDYPTELYDLERDPSQSQNVSSEHPEIVRDLRYQLIKFLERIGTNECHLAPRRKKKV